MFLSLANLLAVLLEGAAETPAQEKGPNILFPLLAMGAIFYFLMIAPDRKQRKQRQAMLSELKKGDSVMTTGGILGKVIEAREDQVTVQVADNTRLCFSRQAIQSVLDSDGKPVGEAPKKG
jgi:preprotein translocase subunit YajC